VFSVIKFYLFVLYEFNFSFLEFLDVFRQLALCFSQLKLILCVILVVSFNESCERKIILLFLSFYFAVFIECKILIKLIHFKCIIRTLNVIICYTNIPFFLSRILFIQELENLVQVSLQPNLLQK